MDNHRYSVVSCGNQTPIPSMLITTQAFTITTYQTYTAIAWFTIMIYFLGLLANCTIVAIIMFAKQLQSTSFFQIANFSSTSIVFNFAAICMELSNQILVLIISSTSSSSVNPFNPNTTAMINNTIDENNNSSQYTRTIRHRLYFPLCEILTGIIFTAITAGIYILMIISIQHYQAIKTNFRHNVDIKRLLLITIAIWLFALIFCLPYSILTVKTSYQMTGSRMCTFAFTKAKRILGIYTIVYIVFTILLPVIIICVCYGIVISKLCRGIQLFLHITNSWITTTPRPLHQFDRKSKAAMRSLVIISLLYILCISPYSTGLILTAFFNNNNMGSNNSYRFYGLLDYNATTIMSQPLDISIKADRKSTTLGTFFAIAMACLSLLFALNPILYLIFNQRLRKEFVKRFVCRCNFLRHKISVMNYRQ